jgi:hypothetical protein
VEQFALRLWLPDVPGVLGAVASRIGASGGNVTSLEVLEREGGVAVDELMVEIPLGVAVDEVLSSLRDVPGVGVEEVREIEPGAEERGLQVMGAAVAVLEMPTGEAALDALVRATAELFDPSWAVLADLRASAYVRRRGPAPGIEWFTAFAVGVRSTAAGMDTASSGVLAVELPGPGLTLGVGRPTAFRQRERREVQHLARVADRVWVALRGGGAWPVAAP